MAGAAGDGAATIDADKVDNSGNTRVVFSLRAIATVPVADA